MKRNLITGKEAVVCGLIGVVGACIFLFGFPKGSITTLMHEVLGLPGPGAGIALILGPFLILVALISSLLTRGHGGAVVASLMFGVAYALIAWVLAIPTTPKGAFGSPVFIAAIAYFAIAAEGGMVFGNAPKHVWRCMISGAVANTVLLVFYWVAVFPRKAGWINWGDIPLLLGLCLV
ncbi:unnamed protein product, partial [marine sediment metagenome]